MGRAWFSLQERGRQNLIAGFSGQSPEGLLILFAETYPVGLITLPAVKVSPDGFSWVSLTYTSNPRALFFLLLF